MDGNQAACSPGDILGMWKVEEQIGSGAMGEVYRVLAPSGNAFALKVLHPDVSGDPAHRRLFLREVRAVARLHHPNLVSPIDFGEHEGRPWLAMELVEGTTLRTWAERPPRASMLMAVMDQILAALAHAHARGVVHRDLKPENVLLEEGPEGSVRARVMDFGIARLRSEGEEEEGPAPMAGTPAYMAPEQGLGTGPLLPSMDLYALGVMFWELLCGALPCAGTTPMAMLMAHAKAQRQPFRPRPGVAVSATLQQLLEELLALHPLDRPRFAHEVRERLRECWVEVGGERAQGSAASLDVLDSHVLRAPERRAQVGRRTLGLFGLQRAPWTKRSRELATLGEFAAQVLERGGAAAVVVHGELGVGKSRLVDEFRASLHESACMQVWYTRLPPEESSERGVREALRTGLGLDGMADAQMAQECRLLIRRWGRLDEREADALHALLDPTRPDAARLGEDARRALVGRVVRYSAMDAPVCVVIDDAHHGDGTLMRWVLQALRAGEGGAPRLFVFILQRNALDDASARAFEALRADPGCHELQLGPLPERDLAELLQASVALPPESAEALARHAGGNPFFGLELLRHMVSIGALDETSDGADVSMLRAQLPEGISVVLRRRLKEAATRHGADLVRIWSRLAYLGDRFPYGLALETLQLEGWEAAPLALDTALAAASEAGIVDDKEDELRFQHPLLGDMLRAEARSDGREAERALLVARARERYWGAAVDEHAAEIGRDYARAGMHGRAAEYFRRGALHAQERQHFREALQAWKGAERSESQRIAADILPYLEAQVGVGEAALKLGELEILEQALQGIEVSASAAGHDVPPAALRLRGLLALRRGQPRAARELLLRAIRAFDDIEDVRGHARALLTLGRLELAEGRVADAEHALREALRRWEELGEGMGEAATLTELAAAALLAGLGDEARALIEKALYRYLQQRDLLGMARCAQVLGEAAFLRGDSAESMKRLRQAASEFRELGAIHEEGGALLRLGRAAQRAGENEEAAASYGAAGKLYEAIGDLQALATTELCLASIHAEAHDWVEARSHFEKALERDEVERNDDPLFVELLTAGAREAIFGGEEALALRMLETARFKLERLGHDSPLYDRLDEVQYLIHELRGEGGGTGPLPATRTRLDEL